MSWSGSPADCPLIDPDVVDEVVDRYLEGGWDYVSNTLVRTYPRGLDVEVIERGGADGLGASKPTRLHSAST